MGKLILITGGVRSGKSRLATRIAAMFSDRAAFIATAEPGDDEMRERIAKHRESRPAEWSTIEEPIHLHKALEKCASDVAVIDCLTLWLSNLVHYKGEDAAYSETESFVLREIQAFTETASRKKRKNMTVIVVTNEIGMGIIPMSPLARRFVELQGMANQMFATAADTVIWMMAGQPVILKGENRKDRIIEPCLAPFRIGTTSCVRMADIETNVRLLAGRVEDIELVIFESEKLSAYPSGEEVQRLCMYAARFGLTYTAHFPLDASIAHPGEEKRNRARAEIIKLHRRLRPLLPLSYILHVPIGEPELKAGAWKTLSADELKSWRNRAVEQLLLLRDEGVDTSAFCFENLDHPIEYLEPIVEAAGGGLCIDVGHLLHHGQDILSILQRYRELLRVVHFYWHDGNRDHLAPPNPLPDDCRRLLQFLMTSDFPGVLTLEVFDENDLARSLETMSSFLSLR